MHAAIAGQWLVPSHGTACRGTTRRKRIQIFDQEDGMRLARRMERLLDSQVHLCCARLKPDAAAGSQFGMAK